MEKGSVRAGIPEPGGLGFALATIDWQGFQEFLERTYYLKTRQDYYRYGKEYWQVLVNGDGSPLLNMSPDRRRHVMSSLSALSGFTGTKDRWKQIISRYGLRWRAGANNGLNHITQLVSGNGFSEMVAEMKHGFEIVPPQFSNFLLFSCQTGLRPTESILACNLLRDNGHGYLDDSTLILEHYKFPKLFLRGKKNAYISIMDSELIQTARDTVNVNYRELQDQYNDRGLRFNAAYGRKIFATFMRRFLDTETIDLLEGRAPQTIFAKHYFRPDFKTETEKIRAALPQLRQLLS